jgi:hypothetical protein
MFCGECYKVYLKEADKNLPECKRLLVKSDSKKKGNDQSKLMNFFNQQKQVNPFFPPMEIEMMTPQASKKLGNVFS